MPGIRGSGEGHAKAQPPGIKLTHVEVDSSPRNMSSASPCCLEFSPRPSVESVVSSKCEGIGIQGV